MTIQLPPRKSHDQIVSEVAARVKDFHARNIPFRINHGSTNSTRPAHTSPTVDISLLRNVLQVDIERKVATVEPNVPMDVLVEATLKHNLIPPVVMEFPGITVGGGFAGSAGESSSFRYGYFDETVQSVEMVLGNGEVVTASRTERADLFAGAKGAMGTLGIVTRLELQLIDAKPWVRLEYRRTSSVAEAVEVVKKETQNAANHYVDGIVFSKTHGTVMTGSLTDEKPAVVREWTFSKPWDQWFYLHTRQQRASAELIVDYIHLREYLFRYDRGGFWVGREGFRYFTFPFTRVTRRLLDDFLHTRMLYRALHGAGKSHGYVVQDLSLPYSTAENFIDWSVKETGIWPLWLCPLRETERPSWHPSTTLPEPGDTAKPMLNIGVWGFVSNNQKKFLDISRALEKKLKELGGRKVLYSQTYYTEDEFWSIYEGERGWYEELREKYHAQSLPTVYDKVKTIESKIPNKGKLRVWLGGKWPIQGLIGIYAALKSGDRKLHKRNIA
jgi:delta24-sterol reductase